MARSVTKGRSNRILMLKFVEKLQKTLPMFRMFQSFAHGGKEDILKEVKGHFAVIAVHGEEYKRFNVHLSYLNDPDFLRLLELSAEEFGFDQEGTITVPCRPHELEMILGI